MADAAALLDGASVAVAQVDPEGMTSGELTEAVLAMQRLRARLEATEARVLARWDADRVWQPSGAKSGAAWLAREQRLPIQTTRQRIRHARALRTLPEMDAGVGRWGDRPHPSGHDARPSAPPAPSIVFDTDHKELLDSARTRGFVDFKRHCDLWEALVDPDGAEQGADEGRAAREVHLSQTFGGMWFGQHDPRPDLRRDRPHHPRHDRTGALRHRLGRRQAAPRPRPADHRPGPHPRPAPRRRPRRDGHPGPHRPRRRQAPGTAVHRARRLRDLRRARPRDAQPHRHHPRHRRPTGSTVPTSNASCSTAPPGSSTSAAAAASSPAPSAGPSRSATAPASTPTATKSPTAPRSTTSTSTPNGGETTQAQQPPRLPLPQPMAQHPPRRPRPTLSDDPAGTGRRTANLSSCLISAGSPCCSSLRRRSGRRSRC